MTLARRVPWRSPWLAAAMIIALQGGLLLLVAPNRNYPMQDDWAYAQMVQATLHGQYYLSEAVGPTALTHILWGTLWTAVFGFSFTVLSLSNAVMNVLLALAFYALLRQGLGDALWPLLGALLLQLNPLSIYLSYTFQTDLTALALMLAALGVFARAWRRPRPLLYLAGGGLLAAGAVLTRQTCVLAALAAAGLWIAQHGLRRGWLGAALAVVPSGAGYALYTAWLDAHGGRPWIWDAYSPGTTLAQVGASWFIPRALILTCYILGLLCFLVLPLLLLRLPAAGAAIRSWRAAGSAPAPALLVAGALAAFYAAFYVLIGGVFNAHSLELSPHGYLPRLTGDYAKPPALPGFWLLATPVVIVANVGVLLYLWRTGRDWLRRRPPLAPAIALLALTTLGHTVLIPASITYHDTYVLPFLPGLIGMLLLGARLTRPAVGLAGAGLAAFVVISLLQMSEYKGWQQAATAAEAALIRQGVPRDHILGTAEWAYWDLWETDARAAKAAGEPRPPEFQPGQVIPDFVISYVPQPREFFILFALPPEDVAAHYTICARTPYAQPFAAAPAEIYTLTRTRCPAGSAQAAP